MVPGRGWWRYWCWHCLLLGLEVWAQQQQQELPREDVGLPTEDEDETDTTWEYSDVPGETAVYTWPELFLADTDSLTQATASFWRPKEATIWPNPMGTNETPSDPEMTRYTPFDPRVWRTATEVPSRNGGHVLLAQGYYMLVQVNGDYISCSRLIFQETIFDYLQTKECLPSYNKNWFWTYPWVPEIVHTLQVKDRSSKKLLLVESYYSLPEEAPHLFPITVKTGLGWVQVTFKPPIEKGPSLVGYAIFYKTSLQGRLTERWLDVISMYVVYNERFPYVRPTHPCKDFRKDRTFCILIMDHVGAMEVASNPDDIHMQMSAFRVGPGPWKPYVVKHWNRPPFNEVCYWTTERDCPGILETGGERVDYAARDMYQPAVVTTKRPQLGAVIVDQKDLDTFSNTSLAPVSLRGLRSEDLVVAFAGLTLLFLVIGTPCVYFLGQRAGEAAGESRWARLASRPGVVHVPLGHGGGRRRGGRRWHPRRSRPAR